MTSDIDRTHHCRARKGELVCTLHPGHKGDHYDSLRDQAFDVDASPEYSDDAPPTLRTGQAPSMLAAIALALFITGCSSDPASEPGAVDAAGDTAIEAELDTATDGEKPEAADLDATDEHEQLDAQAEPELDVAPDKACWHEGQSCTSTAHCCGDLVCILDLCQPCPGWMC